MSLTSPFQAQPVSILVVDDEHHNLVALRAAMARVDCTVVTAQSGDEALRCVLVEDFAVILLDVYMPPPDGFETARLIRARERSQSTPIMFITAHDPEAEGMSAGYRLGAVDYVYKPYSLDVLRSKVTFFVEMFRKTLALERAEQRVRELNGQLEARVIERTAALVSVNIELEAGAKKRAQTERTLRALEQRARTDAETAVSRASALAEVSRGLVEDFRDLRRMVERVAHIAAMATDSACVIQFIDENGAGGSQMPVTIDHADQAVRTELARVLLGPGQVADSPWRGLDRPFLADHPLTDSFSVPLLTRTTTIGVLSLGRFGAGTGRFDDSDRRFGSDLGARVALAVENSRLYQSARDAIELRDSFLAIAAHELKTPLTTIQGYSQLLSHQLAQGCDQNAAPVRRSASMIEDRTRHLARLVEQILDVSRIASARMQLNRDDVDVVDMIRRLVRGFERRDHLRTFRIHLRQEHVTAWVDAVRLEQVMANLIDNAMRYSQPDTPIDISVDVECADSVVLSVRDRGLGIPEEYRGHIFERFQQAHTTSHRSGMGLGLHISREIVLLHGGEISVAFPADGGSEFVVRLPCSTISRPCGAEVAS